MPIRLNKYLASCGLASRRKAEALILAGQIKVNNKVIKDLACKIEPGQDKVYFKNKLIEAKNNIYIMLNKPRGYTCTTKKFIGEKNILDLVNLKEKVFPIGRLDKESEGLIFLTNDGDFAYALTHPKFQIEKEYLVEINKPIKAADLDKMKKGLMENNEFLQIKSYKINSPTSVNLILTQGHKREIRRLLSFLNYNITRLKRIRIGQWQSNDLKTGQWQYFQPK